MDLINQTEIVAYNYAALPAFSPTRPHGEVMRLTLRIVTNPANHRLMMEISEEEGEAIAEMMRGDRCSFRASPELINGRQRELETTS
jgi:hypothetical protein